jgi:hypothetical protein
MEEIARVGLDQELVSSNARYGSAHHASLGTHREGPIVRRSLLCVKRWCSQQGQRNCDDAGCLSCRAVLGKSPRFLEADLISGLHRADFPLPV